MSELTAVEAPRGVLPVAADALAGIPSPAYLYDLAEVRRNAGALRDALPAGSQLYYSVKANPHPAILRTVRAAGLRAEVCSRGEVDAALRAGFRPDQVLVTGPGKRDADIEHALRCGITEFSVDTPFALDQLDRCASDLGVRVRCLLRVNDDRAAPGQGLAMTGVPSPFGADTGWILDDPRQFAGTDRVSVVGLHLYMGTNLTSVSDLVGQFARSLATAGRLTDALNRAGADIATLDLGGGFGAPFARAGGRIPLPGLHAALDDLLEAETVRRSGDRPTAVFESGRYLVGTAGTLLCRVLDVKTSHGRDVVVLDAGINHLGGMSGLRRLPAVSPRIVPVGAATSATTAGPVRAMLCGPLCTPLDTWARDAELPALAAGQLLAVPNVGAYGLYASLVAFLGHPMPVEVVVDSDHPDDPVQEISQLELVRVPRPDVTG